MPDWLQTPRACGAVQMNGFFMGGPPRNSASRYVVNAGSSVLTTLIRMTVLVWMNQYLLRRIEPAEYALVPVITSLMVVAELFPLIFLRGLSRFMVEADARNDDRGVAEIASSMFPVLLSVATVLLVGGLFVVVHIDSIITVDPAYRADAQIMLLLLVSVMCLTVAATPFRVGLYVRQRFVEQNLILLGSELLRVGMLLTLLLMVSTKALWVIVASSAGNLVNVLVLIVVTYYVLPGARFRLSLISLATIRRLMSFSLWTFVQSINNLALRAAPALLLNRHSTALDVAAFHVGNLADVQIRKVVVSAAAPMIPALTTIYATEGEGALQRFYYQGGRYYLWATLFLLPPLLVFADPLIELYIGARYADAALVMVLVLGAYPFTWASAMFYQIAYAVGRIKTFNLCILFLAGVALVAMWYFVAVRNMGAIGAALGLGGAYALVHLLIMWPWGLWLVRGRWSRFLRTTVLPGILPFAAAMLACWFYVWTVPIDSWPRFFSGCGLSALVYAAVLFGLALQDGDRALIGRAAAKIRKRLGRSRS